MLEVEKLKRYFYSSYLCLQLKKIRLCETRTGLYCQKTWKSPHESEVELVFSPLLCRISSETLLEQEHMWAGLDCACGELVVVCYRLISCE